MRIVVLDRCTVTKGDLDLSPIERLGDVEYYDILSSEEIKSAAAGADVIICNKAVISADIMAKTGVKGVFLFATGYNNIDIEYAHSHGIVVCNVPGYSTDSVVQLTFSLLLELSLSTSRYTSSVAAGDWMNSKQFSYFPYRMTELKGKVFGIYGLGTIGAAAAKIALAFGMEVISFTRSPKNIAGVREVSEDELFRTADFISFHCPLTDKTHHVLNDRTLSLMKPSAYIINTSRGGVIDESALARALNEGRIAGAALDVLTEEPMFENCPLKGAENCLITPHIAWATPEARHRLITAVAENIEAFISGSPINRV